jgi:hypothetical protein
LLLFDSTDSFSTGVDDVAEGGVVVKDVVSFVEAEELGSGSLVEAGPPAGAVAISSELEEASSDDSSPGGICLEAGTIADVTGSCAGLSSELEADSLDDSSSRADTDAFRFEVASLSLASAVSLESDSDSDAESEVLLSAWSRRA